MAYRILGSLTAAEDAVQETWIRLNRSDAESIDNLGGWLTTVVSRVCLGMLRSRRNQHEELLEPDERALERALAPRPRRRGGPRRHDRPGPAGFA